MYKNGIIKIENWLDNISNNHLNLGQEIGLK